MAIRVRRYAIACLATLLMTGPIPAWIHVVDCARPAVPEFVSESDSFVALNCCGCQSDSQDCGSNEPEQSPPSDEHDHSRCTICQSLFTVFDRAEVPLTEEFAEVCIHDFVLEGCEYLSLGDLLLASPRGPPSEAAI